MRFCGPFKNVRHPRLMRTPEVLFSPRGFVFLFRLGLVSVGLGFVLVWFYAALKYVFVFRPRLGVAEVLYDSTTVVAARCSVNVQSWYTAFAGVREPSSFLPSLPPLKHASATTNL